MDAKKPAKNPGPGIPEIEQKITEFWEKEQIFQKSLDQTQDGKPFTFYDGPPFATGLPHYGHILASTIKDVIPRYQTMRGRFVRRRWGWDCHGLPIEALVEKDLGISGKKQIEEVGIKKFNETCRSMVLRFADEWGKMVRRMGRWVDFDNSYKTMDRDYMESVWWAFKQVHDKGLAYEGRKVLLYCPRCETPISNFEVAMDNSYQDVTEESVYVKFKIKNEKLKVGGREVELDGPAYLLAWTTTPWTLPGNVALAVGEDIDYVLARAGGEALIAAKELVAKVLPEGYEVVSEIKGADLIGLAYEPLFDVPEVSASEKSHKVYAADFVTTEDGTGIVHTAVVYGEDDYQLGLREGLPIVPLLDEKGHFTDKAPELIRGQYFKKSEKAVKDDLEKRNLLLRREPYTHPYPHCWRCGTALFYNAIPAWFINVQKIKPKLLKSNKKQISWYPEHLKHGRYEKSVEAAPDWNISRNRYWGNPIPAWRCGECEKIEVLGGLEDLKRKAIKKNELIFVRHGEADHNVKGICGPSEDTSEYTSHLTEQGRMVAEETGKSLADRKIDVIVASPLTRMRETVDILQKHVDAPVEFDDDLKDRSHGPRLVTEKEWMEFAQKHEDIFSITFPEGETLKDVKARMARFLRKLNEKYSGKSILIASHGDNLWLSRALLQGLTEEETVQGPYPETSKVFKFDWQPLPFNDSGEVDLHRPYIDEVVLRCGCGGEMRRTPEIFDSWVEAGSMPFAEYHYPFENKKVFESRFPAQFVAEYIAQTRAWFYVMHVISQVIFGEAPFENVVTTGNILAEDGSKMSKSKQNFPDPWAVIDKYGVDSLRFYLMNSAVMQADDVNFNEQDLVTVHRKVTMILWNVHQYYMTYSAVGSGEGGVEAGAGGEVDESGQVLDRWITVRAKELAAAVTEHLDNYDTVRATRAIAEFVDDLSTWYLRRSRGREDTSFFTAFRATLMATAQVLAPFMPHIAEAIYRDLRAEGDPESVHLTEWPKKEKLSPEEKKLLEDMAAVREIASIGSALRKEFNVPLRQPLARIYVEDQENKPVDLSSELADILLAELNVKELALERFGGKALFSPGETGNRFKAELDLEINDKLRLEGRVRELERAIQQKRKERGFKVGEMARLTYFADNTETEKAFREVDAKKTYLAEVKKGEGSSGEFELERAG